MNKTVLLIAIVATSVITIILLFQSNNGITLNKNNIDTENENNATDVSFDYDSSPNLDALIEKSDTILVGRMVKHFDTINLSRNPTNPSEADQELYSEGDRILFDVSMVLKGDIEKDKVIIVLEKSHGYRNDKNEVNVVGSPTYTAPNFEDTIVIFLVESEMLNRLEPADYPQYQYSSVPNTYIAGDKSLVIYESNEFVRDQFVEKEITMKNLLKKLGIEINY